MSTIPARLPAPSWSSALHLRTLAEGPSLPPLPSEPDRIRDIGGVRLHRPAPAAKGPDVLVILLQGAGLRPEAYDRLARTIQDGSPERIWVAVPRAPLDTPVPVGAEKRLRGVLEQVEGEAAISFPKQRVFLAGHSMGGVVAQKATGFDCAGVVLMGSYLAHGVGGVAPAPEYPRPVLTVSGDLDGLTRVTRVAEAWKEARLTKDAPVVVLPGVDHAGFADGRVLAGDLPAEQPLEREHESIARVVDDFLTAHADEGLPVAEREAAQGRLDQAVRETGLQVSPFLEARESQSAWVVAAARASLGVSGVPSERFQVRPVDQGNLAWLAVSRPALTEEKGRAVLHAPYLEASPFNPIDVSTVPVTGASLAIKMKSREAVARALGAPPADAPSSAMALNQASLARALASVTPLQRERYLARGHAPTFLPDQPVSSGPTWLASTVFDRDAGTVCSSVLDTGPDAPLGLSDMHYVKVLPPDAAVEWVLVDGLRGA